MLKALHIILALSWLTSSYTEAALLSKLELKEDARVAVITGTFSPPHRRHDEIFEGVAAREDVDYIVVLPNDIPVHKPFALDIRDRLAVLQLAYSNHPKIIVVDNYQDLRAPLASNALKFLQGLNPTTEITAVIGADAAKSRITQIGGVFQNVNSWLIVSTNPNELEALPNRFAFKPAEKLHIPTKGDVRSTELRNALQNKDYEAAADFLHPSVLIYIKDQSLYSEPTPKAKIGDYLDACQRALGLIFKKK
ncbi:hypothetical protein GW915_06780 [bacterium]|nr:hypothetical protein [bacterium]